MTIKISYIYKFALYVYCISLVFRDLLQSMGLPVFVFLVSLFIIPFVLLFFELLVNHKFSISTFLFLLLTSFYVFSIPYNINGFMFFLPLVSAGIAFRKVDFRYITYIFLITQFICILLRFYLLSMGMIEEKTFGADWKVSDGRSVYELGYGNPNTAGMVFFFFCGTLYCAWYEKKKVLSFILILLISVFAFNYTASRTSFISCILLLVTYFVPSRFQILFKHKLLLMIIPFIVLLPFIVIPFTVFISFLDSILSSRIYYVIYLLSQFKSPLTLITGIYIDESNMFPIDNVFSYLLVFGGLVAIIVFIYFYSSIVKNAQKIPFYILAFIAITIITGIGESSWAVFGRWGSSFFWLILLNQTKLKELEANNKFELKQNIKA